MPTPTDDFDVLTRHVRREDFEQLAEIYNLYIRETVITFEERPITGTEMGERVWKVEAASLPWLVAEVDGLLLGYAYASPWNIRAAYRQTVETSVYLKPDAIGRGIGTELYRQILALLREKSIHVVIGGVALPNRASVALHERLGFEKVAHFKEVGFKFNRWIDVGYWQLELG